MHPILKNWAIKQRSQFGLVSTRWQSLEYAEGEGRKERTSTSLALTNGFLTYLPLKKVIMNVISFSRSAVSNVCGECLL